MPGAGPARAAILSGMSEEAQRSRGAEGGATSRPVVAALLILAFSTGVVDAVGLLGLGPAFIANQTGNVLLLGFAIAGAGGFSLAPALLSLVGFLTGGAAGGWIGRNRRLRPRGWITIALSLELALLASAALLAIGLDLGGAEWRRYLVVLGLATAMGLRNAAVRDLAVKDLATTTVVTMTMTGLLSDAERDGPGGPNLTRRGGAIASLLAGAIVGALITLHASAALALAVCVLLAAASLGLLTHTPAPRSPGGPE